MRFLSGNGIIEVQMAPIVIVDYLATIEKVIKDITK